MPGSYAHAVGGRLRRIRRQQGLSLQQVEERSAGEHKAVVVGSYERGDRSITVERLAALADLYGVPVTELLPAEAPLIADDDERLVIDLVRLTMLPVETAGPLLRLTSTIQRLRGDYNGQVLTLRSDDLRTLALLYDRSARELLALLSSWQVLRDGRRP
jgi:transcriptional regulator with XRE-family HTH domain